MTKINAEYVAVMKIQEWINEGRNEKQIFLAWNAGESAKTCSKGVNKYKVKFNSCSYIEKGIALLATKAYAHE